MDYLILFFFAAAVFGLCWLLDKGFARLFRSQTQHQSGLAVRPNKRFGTAGVIFSVVGIAAILSGIPDTAVLWIGGAVILAVSILLIAYYLSTGIFYDDDTFLYTSLGKKSKEYSYADILHQQLYVVQGGSSIIELHMKDGSAVQVLSTMDGYRKFLDHAFLGWVRLNNIDIREGAEYHDPDAGCWFPSAEEVR